MKIANSELGTHSARQYEEQHTLFEKLRVFKNGERTTQEQKTDLLKQQQSAQSQVNLSDNAKALQESFNQATPKVLNVQAPEKTAIDSPEKSLSEMRLQILRAIIESLTGQKMNVYDGSDFLDANNPNSLLESDAAQNAMALDYQRYESYSEYEKTNFYAAGSVRTEDGKTIDFHLSFSMQRHFFKESQSSISVGNATYLMDPLVVNFEGASTQLESGTFSFDLNADGTTENIHRLAKGSGFLVLDKNNDGKINDGSEMFGTQSGNGFADLAQYDEDGNGWIDENDSIFEKLGVWTPDQFGGGIYKSLKSVGVGAIALQNAETQFSITDQENNLQGQVRSSGVFLKEDGSGAGSIQQIDLVVK